MPAFPILSRIPGKLEDAAQRFRATRSRSSNQRCAIFRLSNELLGRINCLLPAPRFTGPRFDERSYPAFALSHTCKRWRESIFSYPSCWRWIPCTNDHWLDEGLRRSEGAPLHLLIDLETLPALFLTVTRLMKHATRVECIDVGERRATARYFSKLSVSSSGAYNCLISLLECAYPSLKEATLEWSTWGTPTTIPLIFGTRYDQAPPMLQRLVVSNASLAQHHPFFRAPLTHLEILRSTLWHSVDDMVDCLKGLPQLQVFIARNCVRLFGRIPGPESFHPPHCIVMPALRLFTCVGSYKDVLDAFKLLSLPVSCSVHIADADHTIGMNHKQESDWQSTFDSAALHLESVSTQMFNYANIEFSLRYHRRTNERATEITLRLSYAPDTEGPGATFFELGFYINTPRVRMSSSIVSSFVHLAPRLFAHTQMLRVELTDVEASAATPDLWPIIEQMSAIEQLVVAGGAAKALYDQAESEPLRSLSKTCPNLRTLAVDHTGVAKENVPGHGDLTVLVQRQGGLPAVDIVYIDASAFT